MKNRIKIPIVIAIITGLAFFINSRRIDQSTFDAMVLLTTYDIIEKCEKRRNLKITERLDYNDSLYNYHIDGFFSKSICKLSKDSIQSIVEKDKKEWIKEDWRFIY